MKRRLISLAALGAIALLGGCAVVPYNAGYAGDQYGYATQPAYAPVYVGPPAYVAPPVYFGFGLNYRSGGYRGHGFHRGYRGRH